MKGRSWELLLESEHDRYRRLGLATVWKAEPRRDMRGRFIGKAPPDYVGVLKGGRAVVFDAKDCEQARWPLANLKRHQAMDLEATWKAGGLAFIALRMRHGERSKWTQWAVPWTRLRIDYQQWASAGATHAASLDVNYLRNWAEAFEGGDWLRAAQKADEEEEG